jgi:hypothetical protein
MVSKPFIFWTSTALAISLNSAPLRSQAFIQRSQEVEPALAWCTTGGCRPTKHVQSFGNDSARLSGFGGQRSVTRVLIATHKSSGRTWKIALGALIGTGAGFLVADRACRLLCFDHDSRTRVYVGYGGIGAVIGGFAGYIISAPKE